MLHFLSGCAYFQDILGCPVYTCLDECDKAVAEYAKKHGAMGILGQDSDYIIYNTSYYYFSINHLNLETLDTIMYDRNALARMLRITVDQLPVLSCLIGMGSCNLTDNTLVCVCCHCNAFMVIFFFFFFSKRCLQVRHDIFFMYSCLFIFLCQFCGAFYLLQ